LLKHERRESGCLSVDIFRPEQAWTGESDGRLGGRPRVIL
jgi:hypothetical protein